MRKILLLCLLGLSSTGFAEILTTKEAVQRINYARSQPTPEKVQDIVQLKLKQFIKYAKSSFQKTKYELILLPKMSKIDASWVAKEILTGIVKNPQDIDPLILFFSFVKDAETAMNKKNYISAEIYICLALAIHEGALGLDQVKFNKNNTADEIQNNIVDEIQSNFATGTLIHAISAFNNACNKNNKQNMIIRADFRQFDQKDNNKDPVSKDMNQEYEKLDKLIEKQRELTKNKSLNSNDLFPIRKEIGLNYQLVLNFLQYPPYIEKEFPYVDVKTRRWGLGSSDALKDIYEQRQKNKKWEKYCNIIREIDQKISSYFYPVEIEKIQKSRGKDFDKKLSEAAKMSRNFSETKNVIGDLQKSKKIINVADFSIIENICLGFLQGYGGKRKESEIIKELEKVLKLSNFINLNKNDQALYNAILWEKFEIAKYLKDQEFRLHDSEDPSKIMRLFSEEDESKNSKIEELLIDIYLKMEEEKPTIYSLLENTCNLLNNVFIIKDFIDWPYIRFITNLAEKYLQNVSQKEPSFENNKNKFQELIFKLYNRIDSIKVSEDYKGIKAFKNYNTIKPFTEKHTQIKNDTLKTLEKYIQKKIIH